MQILKQHYKGSKESTVLLDLYFLGRNLQDHSMGREILTTLKELGELVDIQVIEVSDNEWDELCEGSSKVFGYVCCINEEERR